MITMVRLKNITINNRTAEADFIPEDSNQHGHVVVDLSTEEILSCEEVEGYGMSYPGHARAKLVDLAKEHSQEKECMVMWY